MWHHLATMRLQVKSSCEISYAISIAKFFFLKKKKKKCVCNQRLLMDQPAPKIARTSAGTVNMNMMKTKSKGLIQYKDVILPV